MRKPRTLAIASVAVVVAFLGLDPGLGEGADQAPGFSLKDVAQPGNGPVTLADLQGKVVLLNVFTTTCPICRAEFPQLIAVNQKHRGRDDFRLVGIAIDPMLEPIRSLVGAVGINYMVLMGELQTLTTWKVRGFPTSFLIGKDGEIRKRYEGFHDKSVFAGDIERLLSEERQ